MFELGCHVIDLVVGLLGKPKEVTASPSMSSRLDDRLLDNMLAVFAYPKATATVKSSALEVDGGERRHLVVCGTEGTFHIQPLDNPSARVRSRARGELQEGLSGRAFPKFTRYVADAADMARDHPRGEGERLPLYPRLRRAGDGAPPSSQPIDE